MSLKILGSKKRKFLRFKKGRVQRRLTVEGPELLDPPSPAIRSVGWDLLAHCWSFGEQGAGRNGSPLALGRTL